MRTLRFRLSLSAERFQTYYLGRVREIQVTTVDGLRVRFPAEVLRPFVSRDGIHGEFLLQYGEDNRFQGIRRA